MSHNGTAIIKKHFKAVKLETMQLSTHHAYPQFVCDVKMSIKTSQKGISAGLSLLLTETSFSRKPTRLSHSFNNVLNLHVTSALSTTWYAKWSNKNKDGSDINKR